MNAIELYHRDGRSAGVWYCEKCRCVKRTEKEAGECCEPTKCQYCGKETGRQYYLACESCDRANQAKREAERFEKAKKVTDWDGWVYLDGTGNDGYSSSIDDFIEYWEDEHGEDAGLPEYVWACKATQFVNADVSDITERIAGEAYEDFDTDDLEGLEGLRAAIEKFNEANKGLVAYQPDYSIAVLVNAVKQQKEGK